MAGKAIVAGGSVGGLFAAAALMRAGWQVDICERSAVPLAGRGAGIVTHRQLVEALEQIGAGARDLGVTVHERVAFAHDGSIVGRARYPQVVTSWDRMHQLLMAVTPAQHHHLGREVTGYAQTGTGVEVRFADGGHAAADVLIGADGLRSAVRSRMQPDVQPLYSGYLVWRTLAAEADLPGWVRETVFPAFGFYLPAGTQVVGYPIAGPGNDLRPGHRRYNFVWYVRADPAELDDMLTDASGRRHRLTIPPPLVRDKVIDAAMAAAKDILPRAFVKVLLRAERPFFTPIYDYIAPCFADGRVALAGDAACVARPHVGMGVTKAAEDALALARHLAAAPAPDALAAYSAERYPAALQALQRARRLGGYIFTADPQGRNREGRNNPAMDTILAETAAVP